MMFPTSYPLMTWVAAWRVRDGALEPLRRTSPNQARPQSSSIGARRSAISEPTRAKTSAF